MKHPFFHFDGFNSLEMFSNRHLFSWFAAKILTPAPLITGQMLTIKLKYENMKAVDVSRA